MLVEIASHGYLVVTTGAPDQIGGSTVVSDTTRNIDWATSCSSAAVRRRGRGQGGRGGAQLRGAGGAVCELQGPEGQVHGAV